MLLPLLMAVSQCGTPAGYVSLGAPTAGTVGPPSLTANSLPQVGLPFVLTVDDGLPGAIGFLVYSTNTWGVFLPDFQATIWPDPGGIVDFFLLDAAGSSPGLINTPSLPPVLCGSTIVAQAGFFDPLGPGGLALTNGLQLTLGDVDVPTNLVPIGADGGDLKIYQTDGTLLAAQPMPGAPQGIATDRFGRTWFTTGTDLYEVGLGIPTSTVTLRATIPGGALGVVAYAPDDTLWIADTGNNAVHQVTSTGAVLASYPTIYSVVRGVAIAPTVTTAAGYVVWFTSMENAGLAELGQIDPSTGLATSNVFNGDRLWGIAGDSNGGVWVPFAQGGTPSLDELRHYDVSFALTSSSAVPSSWFGTDVNNVVVAPDGSIYCTTQNGGSGKYALFEFDAAGSYCGARTVPGSPAASRTVFCDGTGQVWQAVDSTGQFYRYQPDGICNAPTGGVNASIGASPRAWGDPTGYLQANLIFPNLDFDGDGVANRQELLLGKNPFVPDY